MRSALSELYVERRGKGGASVQLTPAYEALCDVVPGGFITDFNDARTHAEVLAAFDEAIRRAAHPEREGEEK